MVIAINLGALIIQILALYKAFGLGESKKGCIISFLISLGFIGSLLFSVGLGEALMNRPLSVAWGFWSEKVLFSFNTLSEKSEEVRTFLPEGEKLSTGGGCDALSQIFLWLTGLLMPLCILGCGKRMDWAVCLLMVEGIVSLAFTTENLLVFFIAFETVLLPMFVMVAQVEQKLHKDHETFPLKEEESKSSFINPGSFFKKLKEKKQSISPSLEGAELKCNATERGVPAFKAETFSAFKGVGFGRKTDSLALLKEKLDQKEFPLWSGTSFLKKSFLKASEIAAFRLYLYTLAGSFCMLVGILVLYWKTGSFNWQVLCSKGTTLHSGVDRGLVVEGGLGLELEKLVFPLIFIGLAVKVPLIPVHLWLPFAHTMAPTAGSMVLAGLLLKLGGYGMVKWLVPVVEEGASYWAPLVCGISLLGALASSLSCLRGLDVKGIIAYSSIVHMNTGLWGIFGGGDLGRAGAVFDMVSHGIISAGLFFAIGVLYNRFHSREVHTYGGLAKVMPVWSGFFFLLLLGNLGLPLTSGFVGEFLILLGGYKALSFPTILMGLVTISNAAFCLLLFKRVCLGELTPELKRFKDLNRKEGKALLIFGLSLLILGIKGNFLLDLI